VAIDSTGSFAYTANTGSGSISGYAVSSGAGLTQLSGSPFAFGTTPRSIAISPSGTFLFVSDDAGQIGVFMRNTSSGALTLQSTTHLPGWPTTGVVYSYLALDSTGQYLYVIATGNPLVYAYAINPSTGALTPLQGSPYSVAGETQAAALAVVQEK
jgi:6-phosphogluconolactonase (cycloisomerase 2 family)